MESGYHGKAEYWYERAVDREPMLFDKDLVYRIKIAKTDSLYNAGDYAQVISELDSFLIRVDYIGETAYWNVSRLYLRLGSAYRQSGQTDKAIAVWRRGIEASDAGQLYGDYYCGEIAESLHVYDPAFTDDSLAALTMEGPVYSEDLITTTMRIIVGILCNVAVWFLVGAVILLGAVIARSQHAGADGAPAAGKIQWGHIVVKFLLYIAAPSIVVPLVIVPVVREPSVYVAALLAAGVGGAVIGLVLAVFDTVRQAKKENVPLREILLKSFLVLWLCLAAVMAIAISILMLFVGLAFLTTFM